MSKTTKTVIVGMSGGVDSSVAALLLKQQGYRVIGLFMKNWEEEDCPATQDYEDVVAVCKQLDIPHYAINLSKQYWDHVFSQFLLELKAGYTPNPDILCNREIKFKVFFEKALEMGADFLATGHYCRKQEIGGHTCLLKGKDPKKDQSYFLYTLKENTLKQVLFPLGDLTKEQIRELARTHGLATAAKKDSTGICFVGKKKFSTFIDQFIPQTTGNFETAEGKILGKHTGIHHYTLGQRRGLGIGGKGEPWFVVGKNLKRQAVIVAQGEDHPSLLSQGLKATEVSWVVAPPQTPHFCDAKIRYRQETFPCTITTISSDALTVSFLHPQRAATPRQSIVFYDGDVCLGGAMISSEIFS